MGLRTTSRTPSLVSKEDLSNSESASTSLPIASLNQLDSLHPDAAISGIMAPALTEPLSPSNKLSSSAASASPRPTAAGSPLQNNNNNNNNNQTTNNNNDSTESVVDENSIVQTNSLRNTSSNKEKSTADADVGVASSATTTKGAFQLAFEQSVTGRKSSSSSPAVLNGDALSANSSQMGPMCDSKSSQPPPSAANSAPLIKSAKISQIDAETAAKIITSGFEDFPSDIEEAIKAEICLRQQKKEKEVDELVQLRENLLEFAKDKHMDVAVETEQDCTEQHGKSTEEADTNEEDSETTAKAAVQKQKLNIISVEELPSLQHETPQQELPAIKTDSTVTASEDDNIEERLKQLDSTDDCQMATTHESGIPATPPRTPSAQIMAQLTPTGHSNIPTTVSVASLTPQSTTSTMCGGGNQKDFKDSDMDHDIDDDLLQVLKGFDTTTNNDICDLAGFLSEYAMNYEDVNPPSTKENPIKEVQVEIEKNQQTMQRKVDFLSRRLRKLQARYMSKQASEEISGLFEWSARTTKRKDSDPDHQQLTFAEEKYHPVSMTTMRSVLKKIETVATNVQQSTPVKTQQSQMHSSKIDLSAVQMEVVVPTYDDKVTEEIAHVSGLLQAEMREVQSAIDSDATASSSGGESADEMVTYNNQFQEPLAISKRAAWRYSRDRASIASRWSWLLSQISDLEFKIRQHTELYQQLRQRKGRVVMLNPSEAGSLTAAAAAAGGGSSVNGYRGALPGGTSKPSGYTTADDTDIEAAIDAAQESSSGACRTRAFQSNYFRKRKLFQTANVHTISKKAARPSTIKCGCQWPLHPCALCTGRPDPTAPRDLSDTMMMSQRVALLDPGFHPVLSFPEDVSNSIFIENTCRDPEWQNRTVRSTAKTVIKGALAAQRAAEREEQRGVYATSGRITPSAPHIASSPANVATAGKRKYTKRNHQDIHGGGSHSTTPLVANKLGKGSKKHHRHRSPDYHPRKNNNNNSSSSNNHHQSSLSHHLQRNAEQSNHHPAHSSSIYQHSKNNKIRKLSSSAAAAATQNQSGTYHSNNINPNHPNVNSYNNELNFLHCDSLDGATPTNGLMGQLGRSRTSSPTHGSGPTKYERSLERRSRVSYDIDNIVIPYSVAAATRVELLPYKEIPTPKWRIVDYDAEDTTAGNGEGEKKFERTEEKSQVEPICSSNPEVKLNESEVASKAEEAKIPSNSDGGEIDEEEDEDISDEAMILRHERALTEERRKFQTFLKFPWSTRSRANRRIDSRAESSGANTPDPASPAPNTPSVGGDQESISSPFAPSTPLTPLDSIAEGGESTSNFCNPAALAGPPSITSILNSISKRQERRRTVSTKKDKDDQRRSSTPDIRELIPPYEPLVFPIPNDLFDSMLRMMPDEYPLPQEDCPKLIRTTPGVPSSSSATANGIGEASTTVVNPNKICDQKLNNNNKNAFLTLNNQKSIEHVTAEDEYADFAGSINGDGDGGSGGMDIDQQIGLMPAPAPVHSILPGMTKEVEFSPFICRNNLLGCSDTESVDSEAGDDDPNDPEWKDEPE